LIHSFVGAAETDWLMKNNEQRKRNDGMMECSFFIGMSVVDK